MARNPFTERTSEQTTTDQGFALRFSPEALERIPEEAFFGKLTWIYSPPGGGKTSLLRLMTPGVLNVLRRRPDDRTKDTKNRLTECGVIDQGDIDFLGVYGNCATGYGEIPPGLGERQSNALFRALFNSRIVGRSVRAALEALDVRDASRLRVSWCKYAEQRPKYMPVDVTGDKVLAWADQLERRIYGALDSLGPPRNASLPQHLELEAVEWLGTATFALDGEEVLSRRLLMLDNVHDLPRNQRECLSRELSQMRPLVPVWLAARTLILSQEILDAPGERMGRAVDDIYLEDAWRQQGGGKQFEKFALSVADRRTQDDETLGAPFASCLSDTLSRDEAKKWESDRLTLYEELLELTRRSGGRYDTWIESLQTNGSVNPRERAIDCQELAIAIARDQNRRQLEFEFRELTEDELTQHTDNDLRRAAELMVAKRFGRPYFYGPKRLTALASFNVEEFLSVAEKLYSRIDARNMLGKNIALSATDQHKLVLEVGKTRFDGIPKAYSEGRRIQNLLHALGTSLSRSTFQPTAPYPPGANGIGFDEKRMRKLMNADSDRQDIVTLRAVLRECVAENLLFRRKGVKQGGKLWTVFYMNRLIGSLYMLPCSLGGWRYADIDTLAESIENPSAKQKGL